MNFRADFRKNIIGLLKQTGAAFDSNADTAKLCMQYLQIYDRLFIPQGIYKVEFSKELKNRMNTYSMGIINAIADIKSKLEKGCGISGYFSKSIRKAQNPDILLRNWNIYHAHIDAPLPKDRKYVVRSNQLLFFTYKGNVVYFIDILPHPKGNTWFNKKLIEVIYDNWPNLLEITDFTDVSPNLTDEEITKAMKRMYTLIKVRDRVVAPTAGGVASSGDNLIAVRQTQYYFNKLKEWEIWLIENEQLIVSGFEKQENKKITEPLDIELIIEDGFFVAYDRRCQMKIKMFAL